MRTFNHLGILCTEKQENHGTNIQDFHSFPISEFHFRKKNIVHHQYGQPLKETRKLFQM